MQPIPPIPPEPRDPPRRPEHGLGHYLRDLVYGALDGVITTLAVVAATSGAGLQPRVGVILGLANLVADGFSMGASNYLALKSELEQTGRSVSEEAPWTHGLATALAFAAAGSLPLLAYPLAALAGFSVLPCAVALGAVGLVTAGAVRAPFVRRRVVASALEMLVVGLAAAAVAYGVGAAVDQWLKVAG